VKRAIRDHWKDFAAILALLVIAGFVSSVILTNQRFRFPFIQEKPLKLYAELTNAQAVTPGQGQTVEVAGVKVGLIGKVILEKGHALVELQIDPRFKDLIHTEGTSGLLRPRTGLKDMTLNVDPGDPRSPVAKEGYAIPVANTLPDVNLDEFLQALDADTREHLKLLIGGAAEGLRGRGMDLAELFRRYGPTVRDLRRVNQAVAVEREGLKDSIHGLALLTEAVAEKDDDVARFVDSSAAALEAFASEEENVSATVRKLPEALRTTTATLGDVRRFADELGPASEALRPTFRALERTNRVVTPVARDITPVIRDQIRPFTRAARPLVSELPEASNGLAKALPDLSRSFARLNHGFNMLAFNPGGREDKADPDRQEGYLFWLAWLTHQVSNLINVDDAHGPMRPVFLTGTCQTLTNLANEEPQLEFLLGLSGVLADQCNNPTTTSIQPAKADRLLERVK
jgi:phospholipid/cholesterol/gamma-HCH transport system substrate-binding protein